MIGALSALAAWAYPYKVDGVQTVTTTGLVMEQSEWWPADATRQLGFFSDDCDGSAGLSASVLRLAETVARESTDGMARFPAIRAVHHTLGLFYCSGTAILAANASHASEADDESHEIGGHAILIALPKDVVLQALDRGERAFRGLQSLRLRLGRAREHPVRVQERPAALERDAALLRERGARRAKSKRGKLRLFSRVRVAHDTEKPRGRARPRVHAPGRLSLTVCCSGDFWLFSRAPSRSDARRAAKGKHAPARRRR